MILRLKLFGRVLLQRQPSNTLYVTSCLRLQVGIWLSWPSKFFQILLQVNIRYVMYILNVCVRLQSYTILRETFSSYHTILNGRVSSDFLMIMVSETFARVWRRDCILWPLLAYMHIATGGVLIIQMAEYRISIYGRKQSEWDQLASWIVNNELYSENVTWLIQVSVKLG